MKIKMVCILLFIVAVFVSSCSTVKVQSSVSDTEIQIDGSSGDWENIPLFFNKKPAVVLGAVNDTAKLNLMVRFNDPSLAQMMFRRGFKVWFDKDERFGFVFQGRSPLRKLESARRSFNDSLRNRRFQNKEIPLSLLRRDFDLVIKGSVRNIYQLDMPFLNAAFGEKAGLYCFEFSVPLVRETEKGYGALVAGGQEVNIRFVLNEMKRPARSESGVSMMGSGRGGGKSGGMRGGGRRGGGMSRPDLSPIEIKAIVQLAFPENQPKLK